MGFLAQFQEAYFDNWTTIAISLGEAICKDDPIEVNRIIGDFFSTPETIKLLEGTIAHQSAANGGSDDNCTIVNPAYLAIERSKLKALEAILTATGNPNARLDGGPGLTLLMCATEVGNLAAVELLLALGADPNEYVESDNGFILTALGKSLELGFKKTTETLTKAGAKFSVNELFHIIEAENKFSPFNENLIRDNPAVLRERGGVGNRTALHHACGHGKKELAKWLIENGAEINALDAENQTPLFYAETTKNESLAKLLLSKGAVDMSSTDADVPSLPIEVSAPNKMEITSIIERLELLEEKMGVSISGLYASMELRDWANPPDFLLRLNFDITTSGETPLEDSFYLRAAAYNEAGQAVGRGDAYVYHKEFLGFDSKTIEMTADQVPAKIRLFPAK